MDESKLEAVAKEACAAAGGPVALAAGLSASGGPISSQAVGKWRRVPAERALEVERLSGVSRYRLRPDVYGADPGGKAFTRVKRAMNEQLGDDAKDMRDALAGSTR